MEIGVDWKGSPSLDKKHPEQWSRIISMLEDSDFAIECYVSNREFGDWTYFNFFDSDAKSIGLLEFASDRLALLSVEGLKEKFMTMAIRLKLLRELKKIYDRSPGMKVSREYLIEATGFSKNDIVNNIEYLEDRGFIDVEWFHGKSFDICLNENGLKVGEMLQSDTSIPIKDASRIILNINSKKDNNHFPEAYGSTKKRELEWDAFICHASEDKKSFVRPLSNALRKKGLKIWYDEFTLKVGDSLRRSIDYGLANSRYGIVVLSPDFFEKEWPQKELDGLVAREIDGEKVILPIWHSVTKAEVKKYSLTLADKVAARSSEGLDTVIKKLMEIIKSSAPNSHHGDYTNTIRPQVDWSQSIKRYKELLSEGSFLSISNTPAIAAFFDKPQQFAKILRESRLELGNIYGWPPLSPQKNQEWSSKGVIIPISSANFWEIKIDGSSLFCTDRLQKIWVDKNMIMFEILAYWITLELTFTSYLYNRLDIAGQKGLVSAKLNGVKGKQLYHEFPFPDPEMCTEDNPASTIEFDFENDEERILTTGIRLINDLLFPFSLNGEFVIQQDIIADRIKKIQEHNKLSRYYKVAEI